MKIRITAVRKASYPDLMAKYGNPIEHTCDVQEGHFIRTKKFLVLK